MSMYHPRILREVVDASDHEVDAAHPYQARSEWEASAWLEAWVGTVHQYNVPHGTRVPGCETVQYVFKSLI